MCGDQKAKVLLRRVVYALIVPPIRYLGTKNGIGPQPITTRLGVLSTKHSNAVVDSANCAETHMSDAIAFEEKKRMWA